MGVISECLKRPSSWAFCTSEGTAVNIGEMVMLGLASFEFYVTQSLATASVKSIGPFKRELSNVKHLQFLGAGVGFGAGLPIDVSTSTTEMESYGQIYVGPTAKHKDLTIHDLKGECLIDVGSVSCSTSKSGTLIWFGCPGPPALARALGILWSTGAETPGYGIMEYKGLLW